MIALKVNGVDAQLDVPDDVPLLWALREELGLAGPKLGCGMGLCGACTVHLDGAAVRSCVTPAKAAHGRAVRTVEGLADGNELHPLQRAWDELNVAQCGYCQPGQLMSAASLLAAKARPTAAEIDRAMTGNLCRCGTYLRIRAAILKAAAR